MSSDVTDVINEIITNALTTAETQTTSAENAANSLVARSAGSYYNPPSNLTGFVPQAIEPAIPSVADSTLTFDTTLAEIIALLSSQLAQFFALYYPLTSDAFPVATQWLINEITNGGTGINPYVEDQVWQRARDRVIADGSRVEDEIVSGYAAKGYFIPAGSMLKKIEQSRFDQAAKTGEASTTIAAKQIDIEIESVKFAVGKALESRAMAMQAAAEYIRAVASAPRDAADVAALNTDAQAKMMSAAASWYGARLDRDKLVLSSKLAQLTASVDIYKQEEDNAVKNSQVMVQALAAAADVFAKTAQAALMSLNSVVSATTSSFS